MARYARCGLEWRMPPSPTRLLRVIAALLTCSVVLVAPSFADKPDKSDKKHGKHEDKGHKDDGKWAPADLSDDERGEWKDGRPPGWSQGAKRGWGGKACPPGHAKKGECPQAKATGDPLRDALDRLGKWGRDHRVPAPTLAAALTGF